MSIQSGNASGTNTWNFGTDGNLTLPGDIFAVNYSNGTQVSLGGSYSNADVANYLPTYTGNVSANYFIGDGSQLTGLPAPVVIQDITSTGAMSIMTYDGTIKYVNYATVEPSTGNITGNYFIGNGSALTSITGGNVSGQVGNALIAGTVYTNAQPNITSLGTLSSLTITANITSGNADLGNLATASYFTGTLTTAAQPNITSVGTLASLSVTGNVSSGNANLGNLATASYFSGNGIFISNIAGANVSGIVANATYATSTGSAGSATTAGTVTTAAQPNIAEVTDEVVITRLSVTDAR